MAGNVIKIRKAVIKDIDQVADIYNLIHAEEEAGRLVIGWARDVYPVRETAEAALARGDLFVMENIQDDNGSTIVAAAIINKIQVPVYDDVNWENKCAAESRVMVLHTLVVSPLHSRHGYARQFVRFYEEYSLENDCPYLRMDTNARNAVARKMYAKLGYAEAGVVPCVFNGIEGVQLVCLEKKL